MYDARSRATLRCIEMSEAQRNYIVDPDDPRAPPVDVWERLTPEERGDVLANLPSEFPVSESAPPEGDVHYDEVASVRDVLRGFFRRTGRRVYIGNNLPVYYPGEPMFSPDVIAITDVESHSRDHWTVSHEGKGVEVALEVLWLGRRKKDLQDNVDRYARLGISEYFIFDRRRLRLVGYRLPSADARTYQPLLPQGGRLLSRVLGLELTIDGERLRFLLGGARLPDSAELIARLDASLDAAEHRAEEESRRAEEEARRAEEEARRAADAERRLLGALAEIERLKSLR